MRAVLLATAVSLGVIEASDPRSIIAERVTALTRDARWTLVSSTPLAFRTYHPQGMVRVRNHLLVSSVEVTVRTKRFPAREGGYDRDAGAGVGHLFKTDLKGNLVSSRTVGEGSIYHPGGIDYDGTHVWVSVAEYRPESRSIVYRVDPDTLKATEVLRVADHLGAVVVNTDDNTLHAVSWGSRRFYRWTLDRDGRVTNASAPLADVRTVNRSQYIDYQDCKYAGSRRMLCTGVTEIRRSPDAEPFRLGGLDLIDLADGRPLHQVPVLIWTPAGLVMTQNPAWLEPTQTGLRAYFLPEDDRSTLYIYEVAQP
jgi:hypothetical protein